KLPEDVEIEEFKNLRWANNEDELFDRFLRLRALQTQTAKKVSQQNAASTLEKRRLHRERQLMGGTPAEQKGMMLAYVLKATANALDSQTAYFTPEEAHNFMIDLQQRLFGIGVQLHDTLDGFTVTRIIEGGPAAHQGGLFEQDLVIGVNGESVIGMDIADAVQLIRGKADTPVILTVLREVGGETARLDVTLRRGEVVFKEARIESSYEPFEEGIIGTVALYSFYQDRKASSTSDLREAIEKLQAKGPLKGLILDLRRNTGGLLPQAIAVCGLFISKGIVASIRDNEGKIQYLRNPTTAVAYDGPLIVLVSRLSASASEIVAGALQDYGRAILVGDPTTYGKGTFQTSTIDTMGGQRVDPKGEFKVTRGSYFTVAGRSPQIVGVTSDIVAPGTFSQLEIGEKYAKYPLENDAIAPNFEDDLSDIPLRYREQVRRTYHFDLQQRLNCYTCHLPLLKKASLKRTLRNEAYQKFLTSLEDGGHIAEEEADHQLIEAKLVLKDLIFLVEKGQPR
ncbi:MAG: S41 family peptidase, partial [Verrucomicrobia bacterium]|nr:S41 family peptidase [Verrucomicrobiota bacterium]